MESVLARYRNLIILVGVLFLQVLGLAVQVKRNAENESSRLIRIWTVNAVTPFEKGLVWVQSSTSYAWHNYFYLRGVRAENRELKAEIERLRLQQVRLAEDAEQARRLQALLAFKEQFISQTVPAQVIGSSGSEQSRSIYIDKGTRDGVKPDMAVITADGVVGKVLRVFHSTSLVLLIDDQSSGVGALLERSRLQGVLRGTPAGEVVLEKVSGDEDVQVGEAVLTSGGDRIFPKGLRVGKVAWVSKEKGPDLFLNIRVRPAANLSKLEEVLVITKVEEKDISPSLAGAERAAEILAQRLPSVPDKTAADPSKSDPKKSSGSKPQSPTTGAFGAAQNPPLPGKSSPLSGASVTKNAGVAAADKKLPTSTGPAIENAATPAGSTVTVKPAAVQKLTSPLPRADKPKPANLNSGQSSASANGTMPANGQPAKNAQPKTDKGNSEIRRDQAAPPPPKPEQPANEDTPQ